MISVVFSTYNGSYTLPRMLKSLEEVNYGNQSLEVIAVNNGSSDLSQQILEEYSNRLPLKIIQQPVRGKNRSLNLALNQTKGGLVFLTDDDVLIDPNLFHRYEVVANEKPDFDVFCGRITPFWERSPDEWIIDAVPHGVTYGITPNGLSDGPISPWLVWGGNMVIRARVFRDGFRFNELIGPNSGQYAMGSEVELTSRLANAGYKSWYCGAATVSHIIREHQVSIDWIISRAYRYGRGKYLEDLRKGKATRDWFFGKINYPRWMLRRRFQATLDGMLSGRLNLRQRELRMRWEASFCAGYIDQARSLRI